MSTELRGKLAAKAGNGKGFKLADVDGWFNATDKVVPFLAKMEKGAEVIVTYNKKGVAREVIKIVAATAIEEPKAAVEETQAVFTCSECGIELKNNKYPTCYDCGKKKFQAEPKKTYKAKSSSFDTDRTAQIQRGNSLNAAAMTMSGRQDDPETIAEMTIVVAERFLEWLRAE